MLIEIRRILGFKRRPAAILAHALGSVALQAAVRARDTIEEIAQSFAAGLPRRQRLPLVEHLALE
jgi:hypothetical protein